MELSLIPNQKRITFYIERLIYGVVIAMPLQPMVGDVLLWLAIGLALYDLISSKSLSLPTGYLSWTVMIFVIWTGISSLMSPNWDWSIQSWFYQIVAGGGMYYLVRTYIRTPKQWNYFLRAFLGTALLVCIIGAYQYIFVPNIHIKEWVDAAQFPKLMRRMASTLQNPNLLGAYLLMVLSVCISYILVYMKENRTREVLTMLIIGVALFLTMLLTYSRGIWISFAAMILYWAIFVERRLFLSLLVVPLILYFYEGEVASRLWSIFQGHDTSSDLRWALWDSTMYIVRENPIFAHNLYLNILAETGIPGLLSFLAVIVGHVITSVRLKGDMFRQAAQIGIGALAIGVLFSGLSDFELYSHQVTIVFWQLLGWVGAFVKVQLSTKAHM
ncbi:MAG: O-antigen ligase family protein [Veillonella sp.]|nr:O-antigen ligase family protein [Veillonella sp.]